MKKTVGYAIIGCGMISNFHMEALSRIDTAELIGLFDFKAEFLEKLAREKGVKAYHSYDDIWADESVDAVCICTPSGTHGDIALEALRHGKNVLIEKPMALQREQCMQIVAEADARGLKAGVVSQLRFSQGVRLVKEAVEQGRIGKLISTELNMKYYREKSYFESSWRGTRKMDGGGALMNQGIHGVDLLQYIAGMPAGVFAQYRTLVHNIEVEDTLHAVLMYENGALGSLIATTSVYPGFSRRLTVCGEDGTIELEEDNIVTWKLKDGSEKPQVASTAASGSSDPGKISAQGHFCQLSNFTAAVLGEEELFIDAREGCKPLEIIWDIYRSAEENKVVKI